MNYLGYKMLKSEFDNDKALEIASWCNEAQTATWQDMGDYYECVDVSLPEQTKEEKIRQLDNDYEHNYEILQKYFLQAVMNNDKEVMEEIQQELQDLKTEYDIELAKINEN